MPWQPGQSGNPKGSPPKNRALTTILARAGRRTVLDFDGKRRSGRRVLARMLWEASITGMATLPTGTKLALSPADWFGIVRFLYAQIDGPPKAEVDVTSGGVPLAVMIYLPDNGRDQNIESTNTDQTAEGTSGSLPGDTR